MDILVTQAPGRVPVTVLRLRGEFDIVSAGELEKCAKELIAAGARDLLFDLAEIPGLGYHGIVALDRILIFLLCRQPRQDCELIGMGIRSGTFKSSHVKLANASPFTRDTLHSTGADMYLDSYDNLSRAIESFGTATAEADRAEDAANRRAHQANERLASILDVFTGGRTVRVRP